MSELRRAREQRKWSQSRAIAAMQDEARALGVALPAASSLKTELSRWENGHRSPDALYRRIFERIYDRSALDLGLVQAPPVSELDLGARWEDNALTVAQLWKTDVSRRDFLKTSAFSAVSFAAPSLHAVLNVESSSTSRSEGPTSVDQSKISFIQEMTANLARLDNQFGGGQVRRAAVTFLDGEIAPLLITGRFSASVGRSLLRSTAELARLVGWMTHDAGGHGLAQRYLIQALHLADAADDKALVAETLAAMSQQSAYMGESRQAVDLARAASAVAGRQGHLVLAAEAEVMEAHAHAKAGDGPACASALAKAEISLDRADRGDDPHWIGYFDEAYLSAKFGHCLRELGDNPQAIKFAERSLQMSPGYDRGRVFNLTLLAHSHAQSGAVAEACEVGSRAAELAVGMRSNRVVKHLIDLRAALRPANGTADVTRFDGILTPVLSAA